MTTPYLKDNKQDISPSYTENANTYIESGELVRFTGAYDSAGTAIYDKDYLVPANKSLINYKVYFSDDLLRWAAIDNYEKRISLSALLNNEDIIVQPPADRDNIDTLTTRIVTLEAEIKELRGGDEPIKPKYEVEFCYEYHTGATRPNPIFTVGCNKKPYYWFINHWNDKYYDGSLTPSEIITQRAALSLEYERVTGKCPE